MMTMAGVPGHPAMHSVLSALVHPPACPQAWCLTRGALEDSPKALLRVLINRARPETSPLPLRSGGGGGVSGPLDLSKGHYPPQ